MVWQCRNTKDPKATPPIATKHHAILVCDRYPPPSQLCHKIYILLRFRLFHNIVMLFCQLLFNWSDVCKGGTTFHSAEPRRKSHHKCLNKSTSAGLSGYTNNLTKVTQLANHESKEIHKTLNNVIYNYFKPGCFFRRVTSKMHPRRHSAATLQAAFEKDTLPKGIAQA